MKKTRFQILSVLLIVVMILATTATAFGAAAGGAKTARGADAEAAMNKAAAYVYSAVKAPVIGSIGGEWAVLGLARSGYAVPQSYYDSYYTRVKQELADKKGVLHARKYTEYSRVILALTAMGKDVTDVAGYNLLEKLADFDAVKWQGINGPVFALIALDSHNYEIPKVSGAATQTTRDLLIGEILSKEITDKDGLQGGFALTGNAPDADITGMALQALAKYQDRAEVKAATQRALKALSAMEKTDGGFDSWGTVNSESLAQAITGKAALFSEGSGDTAASFVATCGKNIDALLAYQLSDSSFEHVLKQGSNLMASEQGLYALTAYVRAVQGATSLYDMTDVTIAGKTHGSQPASPGPSGISVTITGAAVAFTEASGSPFIDENNRTQVPLRATMEAYGCKVTWDGETKTAVVEKDGTTVKVPVGKKYIAVSNAQDAGAGPKQVASDTAALIQDGRTYLPIRAVLEAFGAEVTWDAGSKTVVVK